MNSIILSSRVNGSDIYYTKLINHEDATFELVVNESCHFEIYYDQVQHAHTLITKRTNLVVTLEKLSYTLNI